MLHDIRPICLRINKANKYVLFLTFCAHREAYPEYEVQNIQLAYDITKISKLDQDRFVLYLYDIIDLDIDLES